MLKAAPHPNPVAPGGSDNTGNAGGTFRADRRRVPLSVRLNLLTVPLLVTGILVALIARSSLRDNPAELVRAREVEELAVRALALLLTRDEASKSIVIDPTDTVAQARKTAAYDESRAVFSRIMSLTDSPDVSSLVGRLAETDETRLRPLDARLLTLRDGGDVARTIEVYQGEYEPARKNYEAQIRRLVEVADRDANRAAAHLQGHNRKSLWTICGALAVGTALAVAVVCFCAQRFVCRPVRRMSQEMLVVARERAYDRELPAANRVNELGGAAEAFNAVLGAVRDSMAALREANDRLERRVRERTADLERANAQMAAVYRTSLDGLLVLDGDWRIKEFNPAAQQMFGCGWEEAVGHKLSEFVRPLPSQGPDRFDGPSARAGGRPRLALGTRVEAVGQPPRGAVFPVEVAITLAGAAADDTRAAGEADLGGSAFYVASVRDLTQSKRAEAERDRLHDQLMAASRQAGMADVATGVLHNVGNVLNSANVSASVLADRLRRSEVASLLKAGRIIRQHKDDLSRYVAEDPRGRHLPDFLVDVAECLGEDQRWALQELESLTRGLDHIKGIITQQQAFAKRKLVVAPVRPAELVEAALAMQAESLGRHQISVERRVEDLPPLLLDRHKILQILVNLIANAKNAMTEGGGTDRRLRLSAAAAPAAPDAADAAGAAGAAGDGESGGDGGERRTWLRFEVADTGIGIAPENLAKLFGHGFTTRAEGHGFGLHSCANAAAEMGGTLTVASDGPGRGATFTLTIPAAAGQGTPAASPAVPAAPPVAADSRATTQPPSNASNGGTI